MKIKNASKLLALPVLILSTMSTAANAATNREALQSCSEAIATSIAEKQGSPLKLNVDATHLMPERRLKEAAMFQVTVVNTADDNVVGMYDCRVSRRANVRSIQELSPKAMAVRTVTRG